MKTYFPHTSDGLVDLLRDMLEYNPCFRTTAAKCLKNKIFDKIRVPMFEKPAPFEVTQKIYGPNTYDYDECESLKFKMPELK